MRVLFLDNIPFLFCMEQAPCFKASTPAPAPTAAAAAAAADPPGKKSRYEQTKAVSKSGKAANASPLPQTLTDDGNVEDFTDDEKQGNERAEENQCEPFKPVIHLLVRTNNMYLSNTFVP